jgi:hypothetical protein
VRRGCVPSPLWSWRAATSRSRHAARNSSWVQPSLRARSASRSTQRASEGAFKRSTQIRDVVLGFVDVAITRSRPLGRGGRGRAPGPCRRAPTRSVVRRALELPRLDGHLITGSSGPEGESVWGGTVGKFTPEFKAEAVALVEASGGSIATVAKARDLTRPTRRGSSRRDHPPCRQAREPVTPTTSQSLSRWPNPSGISTSGCHRPNRASSPAPRAGVRLASADTRRAVNVVDPPGSGVPGVSYA